METVSPKIRLISKERFVILAAAACATLLAIAAAKFDFRSAVSFFQPFIYYIESTYTAGIILNFLDLFLAIAPYFMVSALISVILIRLFSLKNLAAKSISSGVFGVIIGAGLGLVSPLPTYVAVPFGLSLKKAGVPLSAIVAFITASPLVNPAIFYLTWSLLGPQMALARLIAAFVIASTCGLLVPRLVKSEQIKLTENSPGKRNRPFLTELWRHTRFMGRLFLISIFISAAVKTLVPAEYVGRLFNSFANSGILIAIAMGVPLYNCGGAAIPIIQVLMDMGMGNGAALAFFITGPMTKPETIYIYKSTVGWRFLVIQMAAIFLAAALFGALFSSV